MSQYGFCPHCGIEFRPVWFDEEETVIDPVSHGLIKTGRKRLAVSHLVCPMCGKTECVDDSFDHPWRGERTVYAQLNNL